MTDIIPFPPRSSASPDGDVETGGTQQFIPYALIEAAANLLNEIVATRRGQVLDQKDWEKIRRACNFIDGARSVAREQGLPHDDTPR